MSGPEDIFEDDCDLPNGYGDDGDLDRPYGPERGSLGDPWAYRDDLDPFPDAYDWDEYLADSEDWWPPSDDSIEDEEREP